MTDVTEIPQPEVLDPDRELRKHGTQFREDDRPERELLAHALIESCDYAKQLWAALDDVRRYLVDALPDPATGGSTAPRGADDEAGWEAWRAMYATVTTTLCGPRGDSGFGRESARDIAEERRTALHERPARA